MSDPTQGQSGGDYRGQGNGYNGTQGNGNPNGYGYGYGYGGQNGGPVPPLDPFRLVVENLSLRTRNTIRIVLAVMGVIEAILGLALLLVPGKTLILLTVILGIYFIISGAVRLVSSIVSQGMPGGWRALGILFGLLIAIGGIVIVRNTALSASALTILVTVIVGVSWIMEGVMSLVESWGLPHSGWAIFSGVISILAGILVMFNPLGSMLFLVIFSGCALLILGIVAIIRSFTFGKGR